MDPEDLAALSCGAKFYRADLHIHSYGASHDVTDSTATPNNIVEAACREGLAIVALADHNEIGNVGPAIAAGRAQGLLVLPGVELSTPEGHLLCYAPTADALERFYNRLSIVERRTPDCRCQTGTAECLNLLREVHGFAILAHVELRGAFEFNLPRLTPAKLDILCHDALLGFEVTRADCPILYNDQDVDGDRRQVAQTRIDRRRLGSKQFLARVLNSDAHTIAAVGRNAQRDNRITRYKMDRPSFDGLRIALEEADTRVRIEDEIPSNVAIVEGVHFDGGFLADQAIRFSPNLTCIIGGRGTGKSTAFEALRLIGGYGQPESGSVIDSDVWPNLVTLFYRDQTGEQHILSRATESEVENIGDPVFGSISFPIETYRQGETHTISKKAQGDPLTLLTFLDRLIVVEQAIAHEDELRTKLNDLAPEIEKARKNVADIPGCERDLTLKRGQVERLKKDRGEEIIKLQQKLESERRTRNAIDAALTGLQTADNLQAVADITKGIREAVSADNIEVGAPEVALILSETLTYEDSISGLASNLKQTTSNYTSRVRTQTAAWRAREQAITGQIEAKKKELLAAGIRLDIPFIQKLVTDEARVAERLRVLMTWKPHLATLLKQRAELLRDRWAARARIAAIRSAFATKASEALKATLSDIFVSLKYEESALSPEGERLIIDAMGWRTLQQLKASALISQLTIPALLECVRRNNSSAIVGLRSNEGQGIFLQSEADVLLERLSEPGLRSQLEAVAVYDIPRLSVTKKITKGGTINYVPRDFNRLSLGQQQSVLLALMLTSESQCPLIVDQPEDNLDSEFIYKTLVPVIRMAKERRQVIVVTHNANIAVLGDAEQIIVLKATSDQAIITSRGSIDEPQTRDAACAILEGSREAFERRACIYGVC